MTKEEAITRIKNHKIAHKMNEPRAIYISEALDMAIKALKQEPCHDTISRKEAVKNIRELFSYGECYCDEYSIVGLINNLPPVTPNQKIGYCKNCKWWKDSDGKYRRGISAESKCPLNTDVVYYGTGYCYMFEPMTTKE